MKTNHILATGLMVLLVGVNAATAADKDSNADQAQHQVKKQVTTTVPLRTNAAAHLALPQAARGIGPQLDGPIPGSLKNPAAERLGQVGRAAAVAEQVRGLKQAQQAAKAMRNMQGIQNLGDLGNLNGILTNRGNNGPLGGLGTRPAGNGRPDYANNDGFMPAATDPDAKPGNRSSEFSGGWAMPPSPRDSAGRGGIGLVSHRNGKVIDQGSERRGNEVVYFTVVSHPDGSHTQTRVTYTNGALSHYYQGTTDAQGRPTSSRTLEVGMVFTTDGGETHNAAVSETEMRDGKVTFTERDLGDEASDPPARDPNINRLPSDDPYAGGDAGPCRLPIRYCKAEAKRQAATRRRPTLVNPGDPDLVPTNQATQLAIDTQGLVTNPAPTGGAGSSFNPPAGWQPGENGTPGGHPGPGGMPPRPGSEP